MFTPRHSLAIHFHSFTNNAFPSQDHGSPALSSTSYVAINVIDRDDRNPKFTRTVYRSSVKENYPIKVGRRKKRIRRTLSPEKGPLSE